MTAVLLLGVLPILLVVAAMPLVVVAARVPEFVPEPVVRHRRRAARIAAGRVALAAALVWSVSIRPDWSVA